MHHVSKRLFPTFLTLKTFIDLHVFLRYPSTTTFYVTLGPVTNIYSRRVDKVPVTCTRSLSVGRVECSVVDTGDGLLTPVTLPLPPSSPPLWCLSEFSTGVYKINERT